MASDKMKASFDAVTDKLSSLSAKEDSAGGGSAANGVGESKKEEAPQKEKDGASGGEAPGRWKSCLQLALNGCTMC